jgi:hypothetical protein
MTDFSTALILLPDEQLSIEYFLECVNLQAFDVKGLALCVFPVQHIHHLIYLPLLAPAFSIFSLAGLILQRNRDRYSFPNQIFAA